MSPMHVLVKSPSWEYFHLPFVYAAFSHFSFSLVWVLFRAAMNKYYDISDPHSTLIAQRTT